MVDGNKSAVANKLVIVVTGDTVPAITQRRGEFPEVFRDAIGPHWSGAYAAFDAREEALPDMREAACVILTGSSANVHHREPWMLRTEAWLRELLPQRVPTLGVCFGHQILAQALGGRVAANPHGREMSTVSVQITQDGDPLLEGMPARFDANACHSDTVVELPPGAEALARSDLDPHQCIRFASHCYGVQFHPEFDQEVMLGYIEARRDAISQEGGDATALAGRAGDGAGGRRVMHQFLERLVSPGKT